MREIKAIINTVGMSPLERGELVNNLFKCIVDSVPRRHDTKISIDVIGPGFNNKEEDAYGVDVVYRMPGVRI